MTAETEVAQAALAERRAALDLLAELALINETLSPVEKRKREITEYLKRYMGLEGLDSLHDGEHGITARFQDRRGTPTYDLIAAAEQHPEDLTAAAKAGMLRLDHAMLSLFRRGGGASWADRLARLEMPGTGTTALIVEREK
jgi:hypothetical protein